jgi:NOL1/NOP2/sun family putative RNA methylase
MNNATYPEIRKEPEPAALPREERRERLLRHLERLLPQAEQANAFRESMMTEPAATIRLNTLMPAAGKLGDRLREYATAVPWCGDAFVLAEAERQCGSTLEHALGAVYMQAKATTLAVEALDPQPGERVLDMAAAPGGKATQIAARLRNTGLLVANEPRRRRIPALVGNLERCGVHCAAVTRAPGTLLARQFHNYFDRVLLDAPCSGDGILCKNQGMLRYWSVEDARNKSHEQTGLIRAAFHTLRPGGTLVYSTCSLSTEENEEVLQGLIHRYGDLVELLPVSGVEDSGGLAEEIARQYPPSFRHAVRVWPHLHQTEGAFVARIRKLGPTEWRYRQPEVVVDEDDETEPAGGESSDPHPTHVGVGRPDIEGQRYIEEHWGFQVPVPADQEITQNGRDLNLLPRQAGTLKDQLGSMFVRAGMRVANLHKGHYYLTQQAIAMWSHLMSVPRSVVLDWAQTQALFRHQPIQLEKPQATGEVICWHDSWPLCRGILRGENNLESFLPRSLRGIDVRRLVPAPSRGSIR